MTAAQPTTESDVAPTLGEPTAELVGATEQTWTRLCDVREQIKELKKLEDELAAALRTTLGRGQFTPSTGGPTLCISPTRRFDANLAEQILPENYLSQVQRTVVDTKLAKEKLPDELYIMCQAESKNDTVRALT